MNEMEFRAYDNKGRTMIYNKDSWLPKGLKKLGWNEHPVYITNKGIHYTLDCISNHYENDWEEDVVTIHNIEIMQFTNFWDYGESRKKMYCNDIISFYLMGTLHNQLANKTVGKIKFSEQIGDWIVVDIKEQYIEKLSRVEQPKVIGNWFDNAELLS